MCILNMTILNVFEVSKSFFIVYNKPPTYKEYCKPSSVPTYFNFTIPIAGTDLQNFILIRERLVSTHDFICKCSNLSVFVFKSERNLLILGKIKIKMVLHKILGFSPPGSRYKKITKDTQLPQIFGHMPFIKWKLQENYINYVMSILLV